MFQKGEEYSRPSGARQISATYVADAWRFIPRSFDNSSLFTDNNCLKDKNKKEKENRKVKILTIL